MEGNFLDLPFQPLDNANLDAAYKGIFAVFSKLLPSLSPAFFSRFREVSFPVSFSQDQVIIDYGEVCKNLYFVLTGFVRSTKILESRGETVVWFIREGDIMIAVDSFYTQTGSDEKLTALKDTFCIALPWNELQALYSNYIDFNIVGRLLTEQYYRQSLERMTWLYESPEVRYQHVLKAYPEMAERALVRELASYLGMARETLSRVRNRFARKGRKNKG